MLRGVRLGRGRLRCWGLRGERLPTSSAELLIGFVREAAGRARERQRGPTFRAEAPAFAILLLAPGTAHQVATFKPDSAGSWAPMIGESAFRSKRASGCEPRPGRALLLRRQGAVA